MHSTPASAMDYAKARELMVEQQVRPWDVLDKRVLDVLATTPRHAFVPPAHRALAYVDLPLPLGHGETMMKPVVEGRMLQALDLGAGDEVLEIGTGSGFVSACLGRLAREVVSRERPADLAEAARARRSETGRAPNIRIDTADAFTWNNERRVDAVCVTGAVDAVPARFLEWLRPGGRLFVVRGRAPVMEAVLVRNEVNGPRIESLFETELPYQVGATPVPTFAL